VRNVSDLASHLQACQQMLELPATAMPTKGDLQDAGMAHVVRWVMACGGFPQVAFF
jgi:hypothetical protein